MAYTNQSIHSECSNLCHRLLLTTAQLSTSPALFLDRDGVIIEDVHYISNPDQVILCKGASKLISIAHTMKWPVIVITNQSGIARGFFKWDDYKSVNDRMQNLLGGEAPLSAIYACGHGPDAPKDSWRKPSPLMLLDASKVLNLDLQNSILIGDRLSDLQAGAAAGLKIVFHVLSGHGQSARKSVLNWHEQSVHANLDRAPSLGLLESLNSFPYELLSVSHLQTG